MQYYQTFLCGMNGIESFLALDVRVQEGQEGVSGSPMRFQRNPNHSARDLRTLQHYPLSADLSGHSVTLHTEPVRLLLQNLSLIHIYKLGQIICDKAVVISKMLWTEFGNLPSGEITVNAVKEGSIGSHFRREGEPILPSLTAFTVKMCIRDRCRT